MKKSEAIDMLYECEWNLGNKEYTEKLLDFIVNEMGFLPPTIKLSKINAFDNGWEDEQVSSFEKLNTRNEKELTKLS